MTTTEPVKPGINLKGKSLDYLEGFQDGMNYAEALFKGALKAQSEGDGSHD